MARIVTAVVFVVLLIPGCSSDTSKSADKNGSTSLTSSSDRSATTLIPGGSDTSQAPGTSKSPGTTVAPEAGGATSTTQALGFGKAGDYKATVDATGSTGTKVNYEGAWRLGNVDGDKGQTIAFIEGGQATATDLVARSGDSLVVTRLTKFNGKSCSWSPPIRRYDGRLRVGTEWRTDGTCDDRKQAGTAKYSEKQSRHYQGQQVDVFVIERLWTVEFSGGAPGTIRVKEYYSPQLGLPVEYHEVTESPGQAPGSTDRTTRIIKLKGLAA